MELTPLTLSTDAQDLLFRGARTANAFTDEPVTDEQLAAVHDLVKWGPTSMNNQPLRVVAVRSPEKRAAVVEAMAGGNTQKTADAPLVLVFAADRDFHENLPSQFPAYPDAEAMFEGMGREGRAQAADLNATLQIAYWIIGLRAAGLDVGPMTGYDAAAIDAELFPDGRHHTLVVANVGHADHSATYPRGPRLPLEDVLTTA